MGFTLFDLFVSSEGVEPKSVGPIIEEDTIRKNPEWENPLVWYTKPESRLFVVSVLVSFDSVTSVLCHGERPVEDDTNFSVAADAMIVIKNYK